MHNLAQLFMTAVHCLWVYDYLLTLGDEVRRHTFSTERWVLTIAQIDYAWGGRRSWGWFSSTSP